MRKSSRLDEGTASAFRPSSSSKFHSASLTPRRLPLLDTPLISCNSMLNTNDTVSSPRRSSSGGSGGVMQKRRRGLSSGFHAARRNDAVDAVSRCTTMLLFLFGLMILNISTEHSNAEAALLGSLRETVLHKSVLPPPRQKRQTADIGGTAFDLLKLENRLTNDGDDADGAATAAAAAATPARTTLSNGGGGGSRRRDDALSDEKCQKRCNERLRGGLDMVKAHSAFGSIGVPSVIDRLDLQMFCRLDAAHDRCLRDCGFEIHFNMRDYVCRERYAEMVSNLACYERSASQLKRRCGAARCGPYAELDVTVVGFAARCRTLLCDLNCTESVLVAQCGMDAGSRAARFLLDYTRVQISTWMRDMSRQIAAPVAKFIPPSCARLFCERFDATNCTSIVTTAAVVAPLPTSLSLPRPPQPRLSATSRTSAESTRVNSVGSASFTSDLPSIVRLPSINLTSSAGGVTILDDTAVPSSVPVASVTHTFPPVFPPIVAARRQQSTQGFA